MNSDKEMPEILTAIQDAYRSNLIEGLNLAIHKGDVGTNYGMFVTSEDPHLNGIYLGNIKIRDGLIEIMHAPRAYEMLPPSFFFGLLKNQNLYN